MSALIFHRCTSKDIPVLITVGQRAYKQNYLHIWNDDGSFYIQKSFSKNTFETDLANKNVIYFIIYEDSIAIGLIKINFNTSLDGFSDHQTVEIEKIYLVAEAAGKGVGTTAMNFIKEYALKLDKKVIWLNVMTTSPALKFYKKLGFTGIKNYDLDYPKIKDGFRGMLQMKLHL
ncbi:GNAT family N-acetyltransferase [Flavobacteriaceae bacterium R38]|nr:GNAT family N-acetyltransferase [Flavobacteriaceae bacterium R38]